MIRLDSVYFDGQWQQVSSDASRVDVVCPANGRVVATQARCAPEQVDAAVASAQEAFSGWAHLEPRRRSAYLRSLLSLVEEHATELAELVSLEMGSPFEFALAEQIGTPIAMIENTIEVLERFEFEEELDNSLIVKEAAGVVAAITPWNYPIYQLVAKVVPALAAGCTVVVKPPELAPISSVRFTELVDEAGFPAGVFNLVLGKGTAVGMQLAGHPGVDVVSFTGSTEAGRQVAERAVQGIKRVSLELGGKSASLVAPGADLETAVRSTVAYCMANCGQSCSAWTRLLIPVDVLAEAERCAAEAAVEVEPSLGPVVSERQYEEIQGFIERAIADGARAVAGGTGRPEGISEGPYPRATVLSGVTSDLEIAQKEVFGPVLSIIAYATLEEAVDIANDSDYGLHGAVWAATDEEALSIARRIRTGQLDVNGGDFNVGAPFGGFKQSGVGRELGKYGLEEFIELKSVQLPKR